MRNSLFSMVIFSALLFCTTCDAKPLQPDTLARDLSDLEAQMRKAGISAESDTAVINNYSQHNFNALRYTLERRHRYTGDNYRQGNFFRHWFAGIGGGMLQYYHNGQNAYTPYTDLKLRAGRQISPMVTLRMGVNMGMAFGNKKHALVSQTSRLERVGADFDVLYSLSNYLLGYRPERPLDVSIFAGVGMQRTAVAGQDAAGTFAWSGHTGLQLKFFAGAHSALALEPYVVMGPNKLDVAVDESNWRKYNLGYGLNLSYIWYFDNVLSRPEDGGVFMRRFRSGERLFKDNPYSKDWRRPFFMDYLVGPAFFSRLNLPFGKTMGYNATVHAGWWLSSAIGLRAGLSITNADWSDQPEDGVRNNAGLEMGTLDLMLNPFGFRRHYNWDAPVGVNIFGGYAWGRAHTVDRNDQSPVRGLAMGYRFGAQFWARLTDDLRLNLQPTYTTYEFYEGYSRRPRFGELDFHLGLTALLRAPRHRAWDASEPAALPLRGLFVGAGMGWNTTVHEWRYTGQNAGLIKNGLLFAGYNFDEYNGVRLSMESLTDKVWNRSGNSETLVERKFSNKIFSLNYQLNLLNLFAGYRPSRRWNVHLFAGPGIVSGDGSTDWSADFGGQVSYRLARNLSLFYSHTLYYMPKEKYSDNQIYTAHGSVANSLNIGLIYNVNSPGRKLARMSDWFSGVRRDSTLGPGSFFFEYGYGMAAYPALPSTGSDSWGSTVSAGMGCWFRPWIGMRLSMNTSRGVGLQVAPLDGNDKHELYGNVSMVSGAMDLLVNPLAIGSRYGWDAPYGLNLFAGAHYGRVQLWDDSDGRDERTGGFRFGSQLWMRLDRGVRFFLQPMYEIWKPKNFYYNDKTNALAEAEDEKARKLSNSNAFSLRLGLSVSLQEPSARKQTDATLVPETGLFAGIGGGWNFLLSKRRYEGNGARWNLLAFVGYRLNSVSALRLQGQYLSNKIIDNKGYLTMYDDASQTADGYMDRTLSEGFLSADYQLNLTNLFCGFNAGRRWEVSLYAGPAMAFQLGDNDDANGFRWKQNARYGLNGGGSISYRFNSHLSACYNHNAYLFGIFDKGYVVNSVMVISSHTLINAMSLGLMYNF